MLSPNEREKLVLGTCLAHPNGTANIPQKVTLELDTSRFDGQSHPRIYEAIKSCVNKKIIPTPANVAIELKSDLELAGGLEYIESLPRFLSMVHSDDPSSIGQWVTDVDLLGRARLIHTVLNKRINIPLEEFQSRVVSAADPEKYLADLVVEINRYLTGSRSDYKPFSMAVEQFEERIKASLSGFVTEIIPCGIPNLMKYCIPRPRSFGVLQGLSGQGKTALATYIAVGVASSLHQSGDEGEVSINILEQTGERLAMRVACMMTGVNSLTIAHGKITKSEADRLLEKCAYIKELPIVYNDDPTITSTQFVTHAIIRHLSKPRVFAVSDYVELFKDKADSEELRVSQATRNIRTVSWETGSCELMLVQPNANALKTYNTGGMFASRYSQSPAHAADFFLELVNYPQLKKAHLNPTVPDNRDGNMAYVLIEKNKDYPIGEEPFEWIAEHTLFRDTSLPIGKLYQETKKQDDF